MRSTQPVVRVEGLWKTYRVRSTAGGRRWMRRPKVDFHALRDVSLDVAEGSVLGIIGHNGAGKSTFLKILSRITDPTRGRVRIVGRVASLLEVGTGFHPELTGLENTYLNAAIHGLSRREVRSRLGAILEFAEIGDFVDEPVKRYSSGMYLRLAFSIAAHLDPDILVVDEILAVGDAAFQARCLGRFDELHRKGRTVIVVSHDLRLVERICSETVLLDAGQVKLRGPTADVLHSSHAGRPSALPRWRRPTAVPEDRPALVGAWIELPAHPGPVEEIPARSGGALMIEYALPESTWHGRLYLRVHAASGVAVFSSTSADAASCGFPRLEPGSRVARCELPPDLLAPGRYEVTVGIAFQDDSHEEFERVLAVTVLGQGGVFHAPFRLGVVAPLLAWSDAPAREGARARERDVT